MPEKHKTAGWRRASAALRFEKRSRHPGLEVTSVDDDLQCIRARGEDRESHGCARHAPAGPNAVEKALMNKA